MTTSNNSIAVVAANAASFLTRQNDASFLMAAGNTLTNGNNILSSQFSVDPSSPFFYIYTSCTRPDVIGDESGLCAFRTDYKFLNGGSTQGSVSLWWGCNAVLDTPPINTGIRLTPIIGQGGYVVHDGATAACGVFYPASPDGSYGLITRWSALCDKVLVDTYFLAAGNDSGGGNPSTLLPSPVTIVQPANVIHGVIQQPWS